MKEKIMDLIQTFGQLKVLVVGDAILDTYTKGTSDKVCREAPVLILTVKDHDHQCGGAANTAINVAAMGAPVYLLSVTGNDPHGHIMAQVLKKNGVHTDYVLPCKDRATISKQRFIASSSILLRVDEGTVTPIPVDTEKILLERFRKLVADMDAVIFSDYGYGTITDSLIRNAIACLNKRPIPVIVDAKDPQRFRSMQPWAVKPNYREAQTLLQLPAAEGRQRVAQIMKRGTALFEITHARYVAVTLDADGAILFEKDRAPLHIPAVMQNNARAIGAGDTFTATMALALAAGASGKTMVEVAARAAATVVQKNGTAVCTQGELRSYFSSVDKYIAGWKQLQQMVKDMKGQGKKIVFTNGCFDILHKGHIAMLQQARKLGDLLIVGLNTDESIRKLKGPGRPINSLKDRISVLSGLQSVDFITSFEENSPAELLLALRPNIFVKGRTWSGKSIPETALLKKMGCTIKIIPHAGSHSTTHIIRKILRIRGQDKLA